MKTRLKGVAGCASSRTAQGEEERDKDGAKQARTLRWAAKGGGVRRVEEQLRNGRRRTEATLAVCSSRPRVFSSVKGELLRWGAWTDGYSSLGAWTPFRVMSQDHAMDVVSYNLTRPVHGCHSA